VPIIDKGAVRKTTTKETTDKDEREQSHGREKKPKNKTSSDQQDKAKSRMRTMRQSYQCEAPPMIER